MSLPIEVASKTDFIRLLTIVILTDRRPRFATEIDVGHQFGVEPDNRFVIHVDLTVTISVHLFVLGSIHLVPKPSQMFRILYQIIPILVLRGLSLPEGRKSRHHK